MELIIQNVAGQCYDLNWKRVVHSLSSRFEISRRLPQHHGLEKLMANEKGPNIKKKQKCKNCEGKGLLKKGDKVVKCQRCGGTGVR
jgi:RecJ-like exonuclease